MRGSQFVREFFEPPDPALVEAGAGGERIVAWTRLAFWTAVGAAPITSMYIQGRSAPPEVVISGLGVAALIVFSGMTLLWLKNRPIRESAGFLIATIDLTCIMVTLAIIAEAGRPEPVMHSQVGWAVTLMVIFTTCLRFDTRLCLYVGVLAVLEWMVLLWLLVYRHGLPLTDYDAVVQVARMVLMIAAAALAMGIVNRSRGLMYASGFDPLTGLPTRAYFNQRLKIELSRARRTGLPLSLVLFDLDRFKVFNDTHGHHAGDRALKVVAERIESSRREEEFVSRWGGEELAMILPGADRAAAGRAAERILGRVRESQIDLGDASARITMSAGVAEFGVDGTDEVDVFAAADRRLFSAKESGRDRVE